MHDTCFCALYVLELIHYIWSETLLILTVGVAPHGSATTLLLWTLHALGCLGTARNQVRYRPYAFAAGEE